MFDLKQKIVLVTGGASGIGEAMCRMFAAAGASVYIADIDTERSGELASQIIRDGGNAGSVKLDVSDPKDCSAAADLVHDAHGRLDILVNNAGIGHVGTMLETESKDLDRLYAVNVRGIFDLTKVFLPRMIERRYGVILNTASIGGILAIRDRIAYCTTKFAVIGMTRCIALDHALDGIRANAICPGRVETPFVKKRISEYPDPAKAYAEMAATQALGRMASPEEIAAAAVYLASDEAAFVTGTAFEIDGGFGVGK